MTQLIDNPGANLLVQVAGDLVKSFRGFASS